MRSTIIDIKNRTGLSLATISKYLNGGKVRPENKEKIDEAVAALHYQVNDNARSLVTNRSRLIGVVVFNVENLFVGTLLRYLGEQLRKNGYGMLICDSNNDPDVEKQNVRYMIQKSVDGIIIMSVSSDPESIRPAKDAGIPVVCLDRRIPDAGCDNILVSNKDTFLRLTEILIRNGHKRIAMLASVAEYTGKERLEGYRSAMKAHGLPILPDYEVQGSHSIASGYSGMKKLLALPQLPTAVVMSNYEITMGAVIALHESPYRYPDDISILSCDSMLLSEIVTPKITLANQPLEKMSVKAADLVLLRIEEARNGIEARHEEIIFDTDIIEYDSVKKLSPA